VKFFKTKRKEVKKEVTKGVRNAVNALTFDLDRGPFGTLNLSKLMIKPNANSDSTIELSGHTIRIKTSEGNTGKIRVGLVCNESGTSCKDVQTLLRYGDIEWKQIPISWTLSKVLLPESTWSNVWIWKSTDLGVITEADEKLWVIWKTRLEWNLIVSGGDITVSTNSGKIKVHRICDENGDNCRDVSQLYTWNWVGGGWDTYWNIHTYEPEDGDATVLFPIWSYNVWIWINGMPAVANNYKLRVNWKTKLDWDLIVTDGDITVDKNSGKITVYQICDENNNCKKVSELYTWNWVGGGGWDVYWQLNEGILSTSWWSYWVNLNSNLNVAGNLNAGNLNTRGLNVTGNLNFAWENLDGAGYNTVSTTKGSLHVGSSLEVAHDFTSDWTITAKWNIKVDKNDWKVNVYQICDTGGNNCRVVTDISTGWTNYWEKDNNNVVHRSWSTKNRGLQLYTRHEVWYTFEIGNDSQSSLTKVSINGNWLNVEKWWLNVTWNTTLNNDLTIKGDLYVKSIIGTPPTQMSKTLLSLKTWDMTIDVNTTVKQKLDVEKNLNVEQNLYVWGATTLHDLLVSGSMEVRNDSFSITKVVPGTSYIVFNVNTESLPGAPATITADWNTTIRWNTEIKWNAIISSWDTTVKNKLYVGNDNGDCYHSYCYASIDSLDEISQIRFVPKTFSNNKQISDIDEKCTPSVEWTLVYWRDRNEIVSNVYDYDPRLSICICAYRGAHTMYRCKWEDIVSKDYRDDISW